MVPPVAFFVFNRPEMTERVFAAITKAKPAQLLIVADGPRAGHPTDAEQCARTRAIVERVDWPCEVRTNYAEINLGVRDRVSSGLDWVFDMVEEAIILEDDCLPDPTFFRFCADLLTRYRDDTRVAQISGVNFSFGQRRIPASYTFTRTPYIWGWASWRRAWQYYDVNMPLWGILRNEKRLDELFSERLSHELYNVFDDLYTGKSQHTWDHQWNFACHVQHMLNIVPATNLVTNIGFGAGATHTLGRSRVADVRTTPLTFPLSHPTYMFPDTGFERLVRKNSQSALPIRIATRVIPTSMKPTILRQYRRFTKQT